MHLPRFFMHLPQFSIPAAQTRIRPPVPGIDFGAKCINTSNTLLPRPLRSYEHVTHHASFQVVFQSGGLGAGPTKRLLTTGTALPPLQFCQVCLHALWWCSATFHHGVSYHMPILWCDADLCTCFEARGAGGVFFFFPFFFSPLTS